MESSHTSDTSSPRGNKSDNALDMLEKDHGRHISIILELKDVILEKCTDCCPPADDLYHCPYCPVHLFRPNYRSRVTSHIKLHIGRSLKYEKLKILPCLYACGGRETEIRTVQDGGHFHCLYCDQTSQDTSRTECWIQHIKCCLSEQTGRLNTNTIKSSNQYEDSRTQECTDIHKESSVVGTKLTPTSRININITVTKNKTKGTEESSNVVTSDFPQRETSVLKSVAPKRKAFKCSPSKLGVPLKKRRKGNFFKKHNGEMLKTSQTERAGSNIDEKNDTNRIEEMTHTNPPLQCNAVETDANIRSVTDIQKAEIRNETERAPEISKELKHHLQGQLIRQQAKSKLNQNELITLVLLPAGCYPEHLVESAAQLTGVDSHNTEYGVVLLGIWDHIQRAKELLDQMAETEEHESKNTESIDIKMEPPSPQAPFTEQELPSLDTSVGLENLVESGTGSLLATEVEEVRMAEKMEERAELEQTKAEETVIKKPKVEKKQAKKKKVPTATLS